MGGREGLIDTAVKTAETGKNTTASYLTQYSRQTNANNLTPRKYFTEEVSHTAHT